MSFPRHTRYTQEEPRDLGGDGVVLIVCLACLALALAIVTTWP